MEIAALNWLLLRPSISPSVLYKLLTRTKGEKIDVKTTVATKKREILVAVLTCLDSTERLILEPDVQSSWSPPVPRYTKYPVHQSIIHV